MCPVCRFPLKTKVLLGKPGRPSKNQEGEKKINASDEMTGRQAGRQAGRQGSERELDQSSSNSGGGRGEGGASADG